MLPNVKKPEIDAAPPDGFLLSRPELGEGPFRDNVFLNNLRTSPIVFL